MTGIDRDPEAIARGQALVRHFQGRLTLVQGEFSRMDVLAGEAEPGDERVLHAHAIEATYGDPAYGGNRTHGGWQRIDFPEPLFPPARDS